MKLHGIICTILAGAVITAGALAPADSYARTTRKSKSHTTATTKKKASKKKAAAPVRPKAKPKPPVTMTYPVGKFNRISVSQSVDVVYTVGPATAVKAEGAQENVRYLKVAVRNGELRIWQDFPVGERRSNYQGVAVTVTAPAVGSIALSVTANLQVFGDYALQGPLSVRLEGASSASFNGPVNVKKLAVSGVGSSSVNFGRLVTAQTAISASGMSRCTIDMLKTSVLGISAQGTSVVKLAGSASATDISTSGGAVVIAYDLNAGKLKTNRSGSSQIRR